jgi:hypothetical protein
MRVEQRIGRVHRLGQTENVNIFNLSTIGTIEEHILSLLHEKINMFELVIGGLDTILERFEKKTSLESSLFKMWAEAKTEDEIRRQLDQMGSSFRTVRDEVEHERGERAPIRAILNAVGQSVTPEAEASH